MVAGAHHMWRPLCGIDHIGDARIVHFIQVYTNALPF